MPHRPVLSDVPRGTRVAGAAGTVKEVTNWDRLTKGQRAHRTVWLPSGQHYAIASATGQTAGLAVAIGLPTGPVPKNAVGFKLIGFINANTVTTGNIKAMVFRDDQNTSLFTDSAFMVTCPMFAANYVQRFSGEAPIVQGGIAWATAVTGTVNYDITIYVVGFVYE